MNESESETQSGREATDVLIIGTGFAGLGMAIRLMQEGQRDFLILERASDVGGTWRDNHYPGAACDVESHLYSFSFEPNPEWSYMFARQSEIWAYMQRCVDKYGLGPHLRFGAGVKSARFDDAALVWHVETEDGRAFTSRVIVSGCGGLSRPAKVDIPGIEDFRGKMFHSARWDDSFSLAGKRVAVVGTGASSIQIVPEVAKVARSLAVFQRTPPWIIPRPDRAIGDAERSIFRRAPIAQRINRTAIFWKRELFGMGFFVDSRIMKLGEKMALAHLRRSVPDAELRARLTPTYTMGCKRVLLSNDYYPTLMRDDVALVTERIERFEANGIRAKDGALHEVDAIVLATGFEAAEQLSPFEIRGAGGALLADVWASGGEAYRGTTVAGFPNLFLVVGPNTGLGHGSMIFMIESQIAYVLGALRAMHRRGARAVDVRPSAQRAYNERIQAGLEKTVWSTGGCTSWYRTREGKNTTLWPGFMFQFRLALRRFDEGAYSMSGSANTPHRKGRGEKLPAGDIEPGYA